MTPGEALLALETHEKGLSAEEAAVRLTRFGKNSLPKQHKLDSLAIFGRQFASPLVFILIAAAGLTIALGEWLETTVILLAVFVNAGLGFYQEYSAENVLEKLTTYIKERARVMRNGTEQEIDSVELTPGDVISLSIGARVPADARIIGHSGLSVDESILTGESLAVQKKTDVLSEATPLADRTNMVFAGTLVVEGHATAVVSATGNHTELGHIATLVTKTGYAPTPLQKGLGALAWLIFMLVMGLVAILLILGISRGENVFDMLLMAAAVSVGAVPEALPIALTVILAIGMQRLAQKNGVMRSLSAAETLGSATVVLTDKTGTLTQAKLRMSAIYTLDELSGKSVHHKESTNLEAKERAILEAALAGAGAIVDNPDAPHNEWTFSGHPVESGILHAAALHGLDVRSFVAKRKSPLLAFNSTNKFSINAHHEEAFYVVLGAPDILLTRSKLSKDVYVTAEESVHVLSGAGKRVLGVARFHHHPTRKHEGVAEEKDAHNLEFLGLLVFEDPLRPEAKEAVQKIERLGASVVMVTGDLKGTAISIGRRLGWDIGEARALSGEELKQISDDELLTNLRNIRVFARVTPEDKLRIANLYRRLGEVVAMTGDGVNDAPSLRAVDIGVALGSGSDVAKSAADLVLLDDNFKTIVAAIEEGRRILGNIRKTTVYLLSTSLNEVILIGGALIAGLPLPLSALQIIWVNMFTESFPALAFAFDNHVDVKRNEKKGGHKIFNTEVQVLTVGIGTAVSLLMFGLYWLLLYSGNSLHDAQSTIFLCLSLYILLVAFSLRSLHRPLFSYNPFDNYVLNWGVGVASLFVVATVTIPFMQHIFNVSVPPLPLLGLVALWLVLNVAIIELAKWWFRTFLRDA